MSVLFRASIGYLLRHPWQLVLAILGIATGVAVMVAVDLANQSSRKAFIASMNAINGDTTHQVIAGPGGVDESLYVNLRVAAGIRSIAPVVTGSVRISQRTHQVLGVDLFAERSFRNFATFALSSTDGNDDASDNSGNDTDSSVDGRSDPMDFLRGFLAGEGQLVMSAATAESFGAVTGDSIELLSNGKTFVATIAGISTDDSATALNDLLVTDIATAQHWFGMYGKLSRIDVNIPNSDMPLEASIRSLLPADARLLDAAGRTQATTDMSDAFMTNLFAMSLLALLVGLFLIYNSVAFSVLQRRRLIGILRAVGVTRVQVFRLIMCEATVIGAIGAMCGVVAGIWLGEKMLLLVSRTISDHYFVVNATDVAIGWSSIIKGIGVGVGATLAAAAVPALEASSYQPRLAMTRSVLERQAGFLLPKLGQGGLALVILALGLLGLTNDSLVAGLCALFMVIFGFALCIPLLVHKVSGLLEPVASYLAGTAGRLSIAGVGQNLSRTGVAIVALAIAVSATIGVSVMVESFRASVSDWLNTTLQSDVYVGVPGGKLDPLLLNEVIALPGIAEFSTSRRSWIEDETGRTRLIAIQMAPGSYAGTKLRTPDAEMAWRLFDAEEGILISDAYAYRTGLSGGDYLKMMTTRGEQSLQIAAVFQSYDSNDGAIMMSRATYDSYFDDTAVDSLGLYLRPGFSAADAIDLLTDVSAGKQSLVMSSNARIREMSLRIFDRTFVITNVLYWLAVGVAIVGIFGAMLALQLERAKEFGVLRALGMTPSQTGLLVSAQTGFIGFLSGIAAIPLGLVMAWILIEVINRRAFGWDIDFTVPAGVLLWALGLAMGAALVAGVYPALNAARGRPALAMREE